MYIGEANEWQRAVENRVGWRTLVMHDLDEKGRKIMEPQCFHTECLVERDTYIETFSWTIMHK